MNYCRIKNLCITCLFVSSAFSAVNAQIYDSNAGGFRGGYGQVYGTFGMASATKQGQDYLKSVIEEMDRKQRNEKQFGNNSSSPKTSSRSSSNSSTNNNSAAPTTPAVVRNYAVFKPESIDTGQLFADKLGDTAEEKELLKTLVSATKTFYENEFKAKGWKNNYAGALTFFIITSTVIYNDSNEPSDKAVINLFTVLNEVIDSTPEAGEIPNREKQEFYNKVLGFTGILLAGYTEAKETGDARAIAINKQLAGVFIELVLKINPDEINFEKDRLVLKK